MATSQTRRGTLSDLVVPEPVSGKDRRLADVLQFPRGELVPRFENPQLKRILTYLAVSTYTTPTDMTDMPKAAYQEGQKAAAIHLRRILEHKGAYVISSEERNYFTDQLQRGLDMVAQRRHRHGDNRYLEGMENIYHQALNSVNAVQQRQVA